jgi:hypothetical protein
MRFLFVAFFSLQSDENYRLLIGFKNPYTRDGPRIPLPFASMTPRVRRRIVFWYMFKVLLLLVLQCRLLLMRLQSLSLRLLSEFHQGHQMTLKRDRRVWWHWWMMIILLVFLKAISDFLWRPRLLELLFGRAKSLNHQMLNQNILR